MKMTKKLLTLFLCVVMVASVFVATVAAAGGEVNASFTVSKETVEVGEEVVVVLSYNDMTVSSFACGFFFDKEKFECKSIVGSDPEYPDEFGIYKTSGRWVAATAYPTVAESNGTGTVGFVVAGTADVAYGADVILTATFVAKAAGTADFVLYEDSDGADGFKSDDAATKTVTITETVACEHEYFYPCDPVCMKCYELTNPEAAHSMKHVEAVAATCTENGNIEHWTCEHCGGCWDNENATGMPLNKMMVVDPAAHTYDDNCDSECNVCGEYRDAPHNLGDKIEAKVPANCQETGYGEHWICADCGGYFMDNGMGGYYETNPAWMNYTGDHVRPADAPDCAVVPCTLCGEDSYGEGICDRGDVPACKDATCVKCGGEMYGEGHSYGYDEDYNPLTPFCQPGKCIYCGEELEKIYDCENGSYAPCTVDGECVYGCGKEFPATGEHAIDDPCVGGLCWMCWEEIAPAHSGLVHFDAVAPDCHYNGNIEHWVCYDCEGVWQDEALTQLTNIKNVILPATGGEVVHVEAVAPGCHYEGNIEYWYCKICEQVWQDEALTQLTNFKNVILPATGGEVVHMEAVAPACHYTGNIEYWVCYNCEQVWQDEALTQLTNIKNVILPALGGEVVHVEAKAPTCYENGNIEHWYCETCEQVWQDEALTQLTNFKNVVVPTEGHTNLVHVDAVAPGCHYDGNIEYWICYDCETVWQDEALTQLTNIKNVVLPATGGEVVHMEAVAPGCHYTGNIEYWVCYNCEQVWQDEALTQLTNIKNVILPALGGDIEHVDAKAPTCIENGNIEHWYCKTCEQVWQDEALTQLTNFKNVVVPATGEHQYFYACDAHCMNCGELTNPEAAHKLTHFEAKAPTCYEDGNIEYWTCEYCGACWDNENATGVLLNRMNVKLPMAHKEATHVPAKDATCLDLGNLEYWYCEACGQAWLDADCTRNTNLKAVILPLADHKIVHVEAKAPTATENGNLEYWYCEVCGFAWLDEACTRNTNLKAVILPATGSSADTGDKAIFFAVAIVAVATVGAAVITFKKKREN